MQKLIVLLCGVFLASASNSQTLFTYGQYKVDKSEFERAYAKNNPTNDYSAKALNEYLNLFINFKLKVQAAKDLRLDTLPNQQADLLNFRRQIENGFMTEDKVVNALVKEAYVRSQKDIHIAHIFIPFDASFVRNPIANYMSNKNSDTTKAYQSIQKAYNELKQGAEFATVAVKYSLDPSVKENKGDIGYITVFSLPYDLENIAYNLAPGKFSVPYRSRSGYHILNNLGERPAYGKMKAAQILLSYTPNPTDEEKQKLRHLADSIYGVIQKGGSFEALAKQFSTDRNGYLTGGVMPDFGIGKFDENFETAAFGLKQNGDVTPPLETSYGIHILKRLGRVPPPTDTAQANNLFRDQVMKDSRIQVANHLFDLQVLKMIGYKKAVYDEKALWLATDSFVLKSSVIPVKNINDKTVLFYFARTNKKAIEWFPYARSIKTTSPEEAKLPYRELLEKFTILTGREYYRKHLDDYNPEFRAQLNEFKEGNLLFEVMEKQVWSKSSSDTAGIRKYFVQHKDKYVWGPSADAIFFTTSDRQSAVEVRKDISDIAKNWRVQADISNGKVIADSARFELTQIPAANVADIKPGMLSPLLVNDQDSSATFVYVIRVYTNPGKRSFDEAKGLVINDYQGELEKKWIAQLKKKYPVVVNQKVLQSLIKK
ncbi:MAG: hypothetical protein C5B52_00975 [Bacteroidetes bacterium]|nr:MAG: hypothetical protein C5B52_00975 [Bacteroidota bacterium]